MNFGISGSKPFIVEAGELISWGSKPSIGEAVELISYNFQSALQEFFGRSLKVFTDMTKLVEAFGLVDISVL